MAKEMKYEIIESIADLSEVKGWRKEVNIMRWGNSSKIVIDIRKWKRDTEDGSVVVGKGISLSLEEFKTLQQVNTKNLDKYFTKEEQ